MVQLIDVGRHFGDHRALGPVSLEIAEGSTVGFLGLNGVGKTTLLRILACDLRPTRGQALVGGIDVLQDPQAVRKKVGYLPETPPLYKDMKVRDYLAFAGRIRGMDEEAVQRRIGEVEETTNLTHKDGETIRNLSHGYKQRVGVAQALIHEPEVLILDEPTNGLDPVQIREMRDLVRDLRHKHTILISSHILTEISETCDEILILDAGEIVASGSEHDLSGKVLRSTGMTVDVRFTSDTTGTDAAATTVRDILSALPEVVDVTIARSEGGTVSYRLNGTSDVRAQVCKAIVESGHDVVRLDKAARELERIFVELVGGGAEA
jgi:ABC-2 type transport system ATP-binding protein